MFQPGHQGIAGDKVLAQPPLGHAQAGAPQVGSLDPYVRVEAETIAFSKGLSLVTEPSDDGGIHVTAIHNGDYIKVKGVDFGTGAASVSLRVAAASGGAKLELRLMQERRLELGLLLDGR